MTTQQLSADADGDLDPLLAIERMVLDRVIDARERELAAQIDLLVAAADWAEARPGDGRVPTFLHGENTLHIAGAGAPGIGEFALAELAAVLGWSRNATLSLVGAALELRHRLPRLWDLTVVDRAVPLRIARHVAECTCDLSPDAADDVDRIVAAAPKQVAKVRVEQLVDEVRLWHDPDRAIDDEQRALADRGVWSRRTTNPAATAMTFLLDSTDADRFEATVSTIAGTLGDLGDTDSLDVRRAKAVGVLADPSSPSTCSAATAPRCRGRGPTSRCSCT